ALMPCGIWLPMPSSIAREAARSPSQGQGRAHALPERTEGRWGDRGVGSCIKSGNRQKGSIDQDGIGGRHVPD
ncbi:MAG: hypothetical protein AB4352_04025, partial [Hormoscilla sp.]